MHNILAALVADLLAAVRYLGSLGHVTGHCRQAALVTTAPTAAAEVRKCEVAPPAGRGYDPMRSGQQRGAAPPTIRASGTGTTYTLPVAKGRHSPPSTTPHHHHQQYQHLSGSWDAILRPDYAHDPERCDDPEDEYADYRRGRVTDPDGFGAYLRAAQSDPDWGGSGAAGVGGGVGGSCYRDELASPARRAPGYASGAATTSGTTTTAAGVGTTASPYRHRPAAGTTSASVADKMGCCSRKNVLTVMTSACASASFAFLCIAVATDYWLHAKELKQAANGTNFYEYTYTGLWRKCSANGTTVIFRCEYVNYFSSLELDGLGPIKSILVSMRRSTIFPLISLLILLTGEIVCFVGHCNQKKKVLTFVAGILFVVGGLSTLTGIVLFIGAITGEVGNKPKNTMDEPKFEYWYGSSFMLTVCSFIASELTGVLSVYLYVSRHTHAYRKKQQRLVAIFDANERLPASSANRSRRARSREQSGDNSPSDTYYTYTPMSDASNYTMSRDYSRHTVSTSAETHLSKEHSLHSVRDTDMYTRRTTPV